MSGVREGSGAEPLREAVGDPLETSCPPSVRQLEIPSPPPRALKYRSGAEPDGEQNSGSMGSKRNQAHDGSVAPCRQDADSPCSKRTIFSLPELPEEIWQHIHSLVPMRDAARAACVSQAFQRSWRFHSILTFTNETILSKENLRHWTGDANDKRDRREYNNNIARILSNYRGTGVKEFILDFYGPYNTKSYNRLNSWLLIAVTPGIEELTLSLLSYKSQYIFPCSLLSDRSGSMIRYISLRNCLLCPTVNLGLRCLTELDLYGVHITGDELGRLLSSSFALEKLVLKDCYDIIHLEIPCLLQRLTYLEVFCCWSLQVIENNAPNISSFEFAGDVVLSLGQSLQVKNLKLHSRRVISTAIDKLLSSVPNLETLTLSSHSEIVDASVIPSKFLHLKILSISFRNWSYKREYDFLYLVSVEWKYDLVVGDPSTLRQMPEHHHDRLKDVKITGFCPQKSLVELTRHILESATSLKCLMLDTINVYYRCSGNKSDMKCSPLDRADIKKARKSVLAIKTYIEGIVPSTVQLDVLEPCSRCHAL